MNPRISAKERNLIKGALRRVFSRSDLRKEALSRIKIQHSDPSRKRVKTWGQCGLCNAKDAISNFEVDHVKPIVEVHKTLTDYTWDEIVDAIWCEPANLRAICQDCHNSKSKIENKLRAGFRKERNKNAPR